MTAQLFLRTESAQDIADRIRCELFHDPRVEVDTLTVQVDNLDVLLTGKATSFAAKISAGEVVQRMNEFRDVRNEIKVVIPQLKFKADIEIADAVRHTFRWNALLPARAVNCVVADGWVLITGSVAAEYQKLEAEEIIAHISGVRGIVNDVVVSS